MQDSYLEEIEANRSNLSASADIKDNKNNNNGNKDLVRLLCIVNVGGRKGKLISHCQVKY